MDSELSEEDAAMTIETVIPERSRKECKYTSTARGVAVAAAPFPESFRKISPRRNMTEVGDARGGPFLRTPLPMP